VLGIQGFTGSQGIQGTAGCRRNVLINANPIVNQRNYVSGTPTSYPYQYTLDRWRIPTQGQSISWTDSNNIRTVTAPDGTGVEQVIEGKSLIGGYYTLNWEGTATATVDYYGKVKGVPFYLSGGYDTVVRFSGGTFSLPQLEYGGNATQFELRDYGTELALCQRYFFAIDEAPFYRNWSGGGSNEVTISVTYTYPVTMRATPSFVGGWFNGTNASAGLINVTPRLIQAELSGNSAGAYYSAYLSLVSVSAEL
jgi:hypothetical protein